MHLSEHPLAFKFLREGTMSMDSGTDVNSESSISTSASTSASLSAMLIRLNNKIGDEKRWRESMEAQLSHFETRMAEERSSRTNAVDRVKAQVTQAMDNLAAKIDTRMQTETEALHERSRHTEEALQNLASRVEEGLARNTQGIVQTLQSVGAPRQPTTPLQKGLSSSHLQGVAAADRGRGLGPAIPRQASALSGALPVAQRGLGRTQSPRAEQLARTPSVTERCGLVDPPARLRPMSPKAAPLPSREPTGTTSTNRPAHAIPGSDTLTRATTQLASVRREMSQQSCAAAEASGQPDATQQSLTARRSFSWRAPSPQVQAARLPLRVDERPLDPNPVNAGPLAARVVAQAAPLRRH